MAKILVAISLRTVSAYCTKFIDEDTIDNTSNPIVTVEDISGATINVEDTNEDTFQVILDNI